jgi:hypothetical protein
MTFFLNNNKTAHTIYIRLLCFVLNIFYSQLHMNGIEQQAMPIQALLFTCTRHTFSNKCLSMYKGYQ